ncbi:hypothetical protein [Sansalvadorimonas verongulae]|uniref:hypothetical protein n=1 Tax=Sansalvadorimonas verongulae TaxID=2172824 RepID=UPI0012BC7682|nr:hypothetical protein [Sansalvadorimonas verongulae]MTI12564.1 hypothetical protein [Sansalvadorimonas verongulae]
MSEKNKGPLTGFDIIRLARGFDAGTSPAKSVLMILSTFANVKTFELWPSKATVQKLSHLSEAACSRAFKQLIADRAIVDTGRRVGDRGRVTVYRLNVEKLAGNQLTVGNPPRSEGINPDEGVTGKCVQNSTTGSDSTVAQTGNHGEYLRNPPRSKGINHPECEGSNALQSGVLTTNGTVIQTATKKHCANLGAQPPKADAQQATRPRRIGPPIHPIENEDRPAAMAKLQQVLNQKRQSQNLD